MSGNHTISIQPTDIRGERGQHYRVIYKGVILIEDTRNPEYDACRALLGKGITGKLETWRQDRQAPCLRLDIERGANLTVEEGQRVGPRIKRWVAHPDAANLEGISCSRGLPQRPETLRRGDVPPISSSRAVGQTARAADK
jgi:hypothetical protein